jgi:hypothetical protein
VLRDALTFLLPAREELATALREGRLPQWWDGVGFGQPFAAHAAYVALNPLGWLVALSPGAWWIDAQQVVFLLIAGLGTAAWSRRLGAGPLGAFVGGATLAGGGYAGSVVVNGFAPFLAWTPWVAWACDRFVVEGRTSTTRRRIELALPVALTSALQLVAGEPASVLIAVLLVLVVLGCRGGLWREDLPILLVAGVLAAGLASYALLPSLALWQDSARAAGLATESAAGRWSMHPGRVLEWIWPLPFGSVGRDGWFAGVALRGSPGDPFWAFSLFVGWPILLLAVYATAATIGRRLLGASLLFLPLAMAGSLLPEQLVAATAGRVNFPEKFVFGALVAWSALAGAGWTRALGKVSPRGLIPLAFAGAVALSAVAIVSWFAAPSIGDWLTTRARLAQASLRIEAGVASAIAGAAVGAAGAALFACGLASARSRAIHHRLGVALALLGCLAPLLWVTREITPTAPRRLVASRPQLLASLPTVRESELRPRIVETAGDRQWLPPFPGGDELAERLHQGLDSNVAARFGYQILPGFESAESAASRRFWLEVGSRLSLDTFVRLIAVDYVLDRPPSPRVGVPPASLARLARVDERASAGEFRPRAFVTSRWSVADEPGEALRSLLDPRRARDPGWVVLDRPAPDPGLARVAGFEPCRSERASPELVRLECESRFAGVAVLLEAARPGWSVTVDERAAEILLADGLFRAVAVDAGRHRIEFSYRTPGLRSGVVVSTASLGVFLVLAAWSRRAVRTPDRSDPALPRTGRAR